MENRSKAITEFGNKLLELPFSEHLIEIKKDLSRPDSLIIHGLLEQCDRLFQKAAERQKNGDNEPFAVLMFAVVKSYDLLLDPQIKVILYNKDFYLDENPIWFVWKEKIIYNFALEDVKLFEKKAPQKFVNLKYSEIETFFLDYLNQYHTAVYIILLQIVKRILAVKSFETISITNDFMVGFGEFESEFYPLYQKSEEN